MTDDDGDEDVGSCLLDLVFSLQGMRKRERIKATDEEVVGSWILVLGWSPSIDLLEKAALPRC